MKNKYYLLMGLCLIAAQLYAANVKYLDCYEEEARLFGVADAKHHIDIDLDERIQAPYYFVSGHESFKTPGFAYDFSDKMNGDFSVTYTPAVSRNAVRFGFMTNLWGHYYDLDDSFVLKLNLKTENILDTQGAWPVQLVDDKGNIAKSVLKSANTNGQWKEFQLSLKDFNKDASFNMDAIKLCEFESPQFPGNAMLKFDFIRFENNNGDVLGITDKTIDQRISEQKATKEIRIKKAFEVSTQKAHDPIISAFAMMYLNKDIEKANQILRDDCEKWGATDPWSLLRTPIYCRFYLLFSNRCGEFRGRLENETEKRLLETLWERTKYKNDIYWARQSTWYLDGSENHDLNSKACNLVSSRIFMNEPDYKDRAYPDLGFGGGYHYGHAGYYGKGVDIESRHCGGRAHLSDGKEYTAKDHYNEWLKYMKEYFRQRAKYGFFVENSAPGYSKHTMNMVDLAYAYSGDEELKIIIDDFMTLYWADWLQTGIAGISGGPKTRHHKSVGGYDSNKGMIGFYLGGPADGGIWSYWNNINGYEMPKVLQMMALDREGMGDFVYQARGIGEAVGKQPNPLGTERTLIINPESRFVKYSYVTPLYTLSTQMDHPMAVHSHLSKAGRWHGMTVTQDAEARIVPVVFPAETGSTPHTQEMDVYNMEGMYKTFQHKNTLIVQKSRSFTEVNPDWFPLYNQWTNQAIYMGNAWDQKLEQNGWIFLRKGDVYAAVRVVLWDAEYEEEKAANNPEGTQKYFHSPEDDATLKLDEKPYTFKDNDKFIMLKDRFSPVIIEAGDKEQYESFENFRSDVQKAPIALYKTVVPAFNILVFTPPGEDAPEMVFNAANNEIPMLDGTYISYELPMTFDSPYLKSKYKSGKIQIQYDGEKLDLDFSDKTANSDHTAFERAFDNDWQEVFFDSCADDWTEKWFLDGEVASVENSPNGMHLTAGPQFGNDAHHMVLWTKDSFEGDIKIEYEYTRTDFESRCVNILYIEATGSGKDPYVRDISKWNDLRKVPAMQIYFDHMNTYHISYAAFPNEGDGRKSYIRARRYMPGKTGLEGTELVPDYYPEGLFEPGVPHRITVIKKDHDLFMRIENTDQTYYCHFTNPDLPNVTEGRIGLRQMFTRSARYKNFRVSTH
jgi:hypothetical protein